MLLVRKDLCAIYRSSGENHWSNKQWKNSTDTIFTQLVATG